MTVENWLRGQFQGIGTQIEASVLEAAALSPVFAKPTRLRPTSLSDDVEDYIEDQDYLDGLNYALSTLYYSMSGATDGGTRSEKRGNRQISIGGKAIDVATRQAWRDEADRIRTKLGCEVKAVADTGGMFDASNLRRRRL